MADKPNFDIQEVHHYFASECFNQTWELMDKDGGRSIEDNTEMLHTAIASLWHWSQREDVTSTNLSIGYWQVSRVYCLIEQPHNARRYGLLSLKYARELSPFLRGYAYETLARAEMIANNRVIMKEYLVKAFELLEQVQDEEDRRTLATDLETIR